ncbi:MAG: hypothetical protein BroJett025_00780 [Patescibacteria group bacterium]|nr:MAG: hypothetical protein BroJett025_00780 [Patescibacteria group bacterium]
MKPKIIVYLPVIHAGYLHFLESHKNADIFITNESLIELIDQEFDYLRKEIRAISPTQAEVSLEALLPERKISLLSANDLPFLDEPGQEIILPKEDIFIWIARKYLTKSKIVFDDTFLRWNRENTLEKQSVQNKQTKTEKNFGELIQSLVAKTKKTAQLSSDWWRQVGALVFSEKPHKIIAIAHNHHLPSPYTPYIDSDPRNSFHKGEHIDLSTAVHAEAAIIADCAKKGVPLQGTSMYVSTFPCPVCAKQIAASGIAKLYYSDGYSILDGERILTNSNVKVVLIND